MQSLLFSKCRKNMVVHPRLAYQTLPAFDIDQTILNRFPNFEPFPGKKYHQLILVMDWDHKLPSRKIFSRVYAYYEQDAFNIAWREIQIRRREIAERNDFPEFDVHDFEDIPADESYLLHLSLEGDCRKVEFVSAWKHRVQETELACAMQILENDPLYQEAILSRKQNCGPARAVAWVPPCVSKLPVWTVDTRVLTYCEGPSMWGRFFLVDCQGRHVLHSGNFHIRT